MATTAKQREERAARERTRQYQARQTLHAQSVRRRTRDNVLVGVAGGILLLALVAGQSAYYLVGPGAPAPTPDPSITGASPEPSDAPDGILPTP